MSRGEVIEGFDYVRGTGCRMTPTEWRARYPAGKFLRAVNRAPGETWYLEQIPGAEVRSFRLVAEAYAVIRA